MNTFLCIAAVAIDHHQVRYRYITSRNPLY